MSIANISTDSVEQLSDCAVELMLCWDDHTWSSEVFVLVDEESQADLLPALYIEYLNKHKKDECNVHHSEGGYGGLVQVAVYCIQLVEEDELGDPNYVWDYKLVDGQIIEVTE